MFQFPTFPSYTLLYSCMDKPASSWFEFPHSDIHGSKDICSLPWLFAAYHVLLRLLVPRHSPYALCSLTFWLRLNFVLLRQASIKIFSIYTRIISKIFSYFPRITRLYYVILLLINRFFSLLQFSQCLTLSQLLLVELLY